MPGGATEKFRLPDAGVKGSLASGSSGPPHTHRVGGNHVRRLMGKTTGPSFVPSRLQTLARSTTLLLRPATRRARRRLWRPAVLRTWGCAAGTDTLREGQYRMFGACN